MKNIFLILFFSYCLFGCEKEETKAEQYTRLTRGIVYFKDNSDPNRPLCFALFDAYSSPITNVPCEAVEYRLVNGARKQSIMSKHKVAFYECNGYGCTSTTIWKKDEIPPDWKWNMSDGNHYSEPEEFHFCPTCSKDESKHPYVKGSRQ